MNRQEKQRHREMIYMTQKNKTADAAPKKEALKGGAEAGDFKRVRAAPKATVKGKAAKEGVREKPANEAQETFGPADPKSVSKSEQLSRKVNQEFFDKHENEDERNTEYASQREETRRQLWGNAQRPFEEVNGRLGQSSGCPGH